MTTLVRPATLADAPRLSQLGANTFRETFEGENTPDDMASYLAERSHRTVRRPRISDAFGVVLLAERPDAPEAEKLVGYAHLVSGLAPPAVQGLAPMELKRLYVTRSWHGKGVAQALMGAALEAARARGAKTLWLGVWERNHRAVAFYGKSQLQPRGRARVCARLRRANRLAVGPSTLRGGVKQQSLKIGLHLNEQ